MMNIVRVMSELCRLTVTNTLLLFDLNRKRLRRNYLKRIGVLTSTDSYPYRSLTRERINMGYLTGCDIDERCQLLIDYRTSLPTSYSLKWYS